MTDAEIHEQMKELLGQPYEVLADWSLMSSEQWHILKNQESN
jgi:hypothetical protein